MVASFADACELPTQPKVASTEERANPTSLLPGSVTGSLACGDKTPERQEKPVSRRISDVLAAEHGNSIELREAHLLEQSYLGRHARSSVINHPLPTCAALPLRWSPGDQG